MPTSLLFCASDRCHSRNYWSSRFNQNVERQSFSLTILHALQTMKVVEHSPFSTFTSRTFSVRCTKEVCKVNADTEAGND